MSHHRDARAHDASNVFGDLFASFELDRLEGSLLHELSRALDGLFRRHLVAHERKVADEVSMGRAARTTARPW